MKSVRNIKSSSLLTGISTKLSNVYEFKNFFMTEFSLRPIIEGLDFEVFTLPSERLLATEF